ncbi:hypothetical protein MJO28_006149 [Puccinia striiformis f. sp. tritici]|uniref:Uncharacterized protein n=1 Tax=Puccinia striiformis f. sp. tritici TaxID=168172 RepID=A0ACC0EIB7_9BASI|nr:hypothetical protein MJO28_006149 [Puccinia striiformis f. sp. tritici]
MAIDLAPKSTNPAGGFVHRPRVAPDSGGVQPSRESSRAALGDRLRTRNGGPPIAQIPYTGAFSLSLQPAASDDAAGPNSARATVEPAGSAATLGSMSRHFVRHRNQTPAGHRHRHCLPRSSRCGRPEREPMDGPS